MDVAGFAVGYGAAAKQATAGEAEEAEAPAKLRNSRPRRARSGCRGTARKKMLYADYQFQAQKQGRKASELIRNAMQDYADLHFKTKKSLKDIDFSRTVSLRPGASDFLSDKRTLAWMNMYKLGRNRVNVTQLASCYLSNNITSIITANPNDFEIFGSFELRDYR